jgi:alkylation response protein AidB-like acyl-CoA dehydrogenase
MTGTDDLDGYRAAMRVWLADNLPKRDRRATLRSAKEITPEQLAEGRALQRSLYDAGYLGIAIPADYGGQGLTAAHQRVWEQESAAYAVPMPAGVASNVTLHIVLPIVLAYGSEEQKRDWVPKMLSGEEIWVQLLSEPEAGSDLAGVLTRATRDNDVWVLSGTKVWSSGAMCADYGVCLARTDWDAPKHRGLTWFKVPLRDPRVTVRPIREINGSSEFCEEFLDDVVVGDDMVIGEVNGGWPIANAMLAFERANTGTHDIVMPEGSSGRRLATDLVELATARGTTGDPAVRQLIARAHTEDYVTGLLTRRVMAGMLAGTVNPTAASLVKLAQGIVQPERACAAMEVAGRTGVAWRGSGDPGEAAAVNYLNGRIMAIAGGSNQIQRNIISERLLGLPREPSDEKVKPFREMLRDAKNWGRA